ncbi:patatin-like phospholipase family protein [Psychrosphaera aestuarii]|uniref:patatin-like phospholipase family protein n=1 Tax=Psychrosphaera aestuarii TaxID=1266052 RepID=UPI001B31F21D|nr:patatin-like phospholipase family protein [Psychrosphaera aestuarii]
MIGDTDYSQVNMTEPQEGLALVAEGGGQRGVFTAGVLDSWLLSNFNPFEILVGTSAGAQNIASFMSHQFGYAYSAISDLTNSDEFFNVWSAFKGKHVMDLDWYFNQVEDSAYQLDTETAALKAKNRKLFFSSTKANSMETALLDPNKIGWIPALKASSAIPFLYRRGVTLNKEPLVDGGVSAPIPIEEAIHLGANKAVIIRTSKTAETAIGEVLKRAKPIFCSRNRTPQVYKILEVHEASYAKAQSMIQNPPKGVNVVEVTPARPLQSKVLGSTKEALIADYKMGLKAGHDFLIQHNLLNPKNTKRLHS